MEDGDDVMWRYLMLLYEEWRMKINDFKEAKSTGLPLHFWPLIYLSHITWAITSLVIKYKDDIASDILHVIKDVYLYLAYDRTGIRRRSFYI